MPTYCRSGAERKRLSAHVYCNSWPFVDIVASADRRRKTVVPSSVDAVFLSEQGDSTTTATIERRHNVLSGVCGQHVELTYGIADLG